MTRPDHPAQAVRPPLVLRPCADPLVPDARRVIARPFISSDRLAPDDALVGRILALPEAAVHETLAASLGRFGERHIDIDQVLDDHFLFASGDIADVGELSRDRRRLIGAYYTYEYSVEGAALTNPSIVVAPEQTGAAPGSTRVVLSVRAVGEGHLSSIEFREGVIDALGDVAIVPPSPHVITGTHRPVGALRDGEYEVEFPADSPLSARVIFPWLAAERGGVEDARFVRFVDDDGSLTYFATYTAFDGARLVPRLLQSTDLRTFRMSALHGACAANKGAALFPRRIGGRFAALSRFDAESSYVMFSDDPRRWETADKVESPTASWQLARVGNCGSPIETAAGWLVLTHGVGPFRTYSIGAMLLDLDDPRQVLGRLEAPLIEGSGVSREGYVPNVVYSCGAMVHDDQLILPYGVADTTCRIAKLPLDALLERLTA